MSDQLEDKKPMSVSFSAMTRAREKHSSNSTPGVYTYELPTYAPGVLPGGRTTLAMDDMSGFQVNNVFSYAQASDMFEEGLGFLGYPYLAQLSQRTEHRRPVEIIAEEMTRKWIKFEASSGDDSKSDKIKDIEADFRTYKVQHIVNSALEYDGYMGLAHIYIDVGTSDDTDELMTPLPRRKEKIGKGSLKGFTIVDPTWVAPNDYNSNDPLSPKFYRPQTWFIMSRLVHHTRLITVVSRPVPDILKPAYNFGGMALTQLMKPYVDNWLKTRKGVADLILAFTVFVLETNLEGLLSGGNGESEMRRIQTFEYMKNNLGLMVLDKDNEVLSNVSAPLGTLDHLQAQSQEHMTNPPGIPSVKMFGVTPSGLNVSSDSEIRVFYDMIRARQEKVMTPIIQTMLDVIQLNRFGEIDDDITFSFNSLFELDEAATAAVRKTEADTDSIYLEQGIIEQEDVRRRVAMSKSSLYPGLNLSEEPPGPPDDLLTQEDPLQARGKENVTQRSETIRKSF